jgi:hypothetical protein
MSWTQGIKWNMIRIVKMHFVKFKEGTTFCLPMIWYLVIVFPLPRYYHNSTLSKHPFTLCPLLHSRSLPDSLSLRHRSCTPLPPPFASSLPSPSNSSFFAWCFAGLHFRAWWTRNLCFLLRWWEEGAPGSPLIPTWRTVCVRVPGEGGAPPSHFLSASLYETSTKYTSRQEVKCLN